MAWLKIYQSIRQHRKILDAADALEIAPPHMRGEWQQAVIHCLAAVFLRLDDVFLIVTATR